MCIIHTVHISSDKQSFVPRAKQVIPGPDPLRLRILIPHFFPQTTALKIRITNLGIGFCVNVFFIINVAVISDMIQIYICKIFAQCILLYFLQFFILQTLLHIIFQDDLCCHGIRLPVEIIQSYPHLLIHKFILIHNHICHIPSDISPYTDAGKNQCQYQKRTHILQILFLDS